LSCQFGISLSLSRTPGKTLNCTGALSKAILLTCTEHKRIQNVTDISLEYVELTINTNDGEYVICPLNACSDLEPHEVDNYKDAFSTIVNQFEAVKNIDSYLPETTLEFNVGHLLLNCTDEFYEDN
jgi:hypothetical protein